MTPKELKERTKAYALRIIRLVDALPAGRSTDVLGRQLLRAGTSVGANYRAACRARSHADFVSKLGIVEEECDESLYWMELLVAAKKVPATRVANWMAEGNELLAIVVASLRTSRTRRNPQSEIRNPQSK
jgi:four helix bundle protein